jgi:hypothetical protein
MVAIDKLKLRREDRILSLEVNREAMVKICGRY